MRRLTSYVLSTVPRSSCGSSGKYRVPRGENLGPIRQASGNVTVYMHSRTDSPGSLGISARELTARTVGRNRRDCLSLD